MRGILAFTLILALSSPACAGQAVGNGSVQIPVPAAQGGVPNAPIPATGVITKVIGFGDSITAGVLTGVTCSTGTAYHSPTGTCYIDTVASFYGAQVSNLGINGTCMELTASGYCNTFGNSGYSRYTNLSSNASPGFGGLLTTPSTTLVVITYGVNDVNSGDTGASPVLYNTQLGTIISYLITAGVPSGNIVLGAIPYTSYSNIAGGGSASLYAEIGEQIAYLAATKLTSYADYWAVTDSCWNTNVITFGTVCSLSDGIHPNATGMALYATAVETATYQKAVGAYGSFSALVAAWTMGKSPTGQTFLTAGSGTYTTPIGVKWISVVAQGGGGGGAATGTSPGAATSGGTTLFGSSQIEAGGGANSSNLNGANGGSAFCLFSCIDALSLPGGGGNSADCGTACGFSVAGGGANGGSGPLGGAGQGGSGGGGAGGAGSANTGGGGGGGGILSGNGSGGGGSGAYVRTILVAPLATYAYTVGAGGSGGTAGTGGQNGGAGGTGGIWVEEHYNF
jgi:lysophospholipase L1-like esterase